MADSLRFLASFGYLLCFCVLFFSFNSYKSCVQGARELANHQNVVNKNKSLMPAPVSTSTTGSDLTWIQCQPCDKCYDQEEPIFDPSKSSTFSDAACNTPTCPYSITYNDHSYSIGNYAKDTLTLSSTAVFPDFVFGCGKNNSDSTNGESFGKVAGILGLGRGPTSILSQILSILGQEFCYCLPLQETSTGYLRLGKIASDTCKPEISTPIFMGSNWPDKYLVRLAGITVGQKRLEMSANFVSNSLASTIIDSGTPISRLPGSVYAELRSTFQDLMSNYTIAAVDPSSLLDTCYDLSGNDDDINNIVPSMKLHFDGFQDLNLEPSAVFLKESDSRKVCLAFAGNENSDELTIIGSHQQRNLKISYSLRLLGLGLKVGFSTGGCGN
ncbi:hypothetical protein QYF36_009888 [Acer negundo]|nr:hypothetical protein QYF36_009888 [Acer negundo]